MFTGFNYFNICLLFGGIVALAAGFVVFIRNKNNKVNQSWLLVTISTAFWGFGYFAMISTFDKTISLYANWFLHFSAILVPPLFFRFILRLTNNIKNYKKSLFIIYLFALAFLIINPTKLFVVDVKPKYIFPYVCDAGPLYILFALYFFSVASVSLYVLLLTIKKSTGVYYQQLKLVFISSFFGFAGGGSVFLLTFNIPFPPYPIILFSLYPVVISYSILKYRFLDVRLVIARTIIFGLFVGLLTFTYSVISAFIASYFENLIGFNSYILTGVVVSFLVITGYAPLKKILERLTSKFLFKTTYNPDIVLSDISNVASSIVDLRQLLASISNILDSAFHCEKIAVAMLDKEGKLYLAHQQGFDPDALKNFTMGKEQVLPAYFSSSHEVQVIDELKTRYEAGEYQPKSVELLDSLYGMDIALVVPLFVKDEMIGVFVLGNKKSGEPYSHQDLNIIKIIAGQSAIAIENASLYDELKDYNVKLDQEVKKKTAELRKANEELKQLDEAKSEFISIASHQLRTPLTIIKGYISMMLEGNFGKVPVKINDNLKKVFSANERLINLVENLLDISRIESGRQEFNFSRARLEDMAAVVVDNFKNNAKDKKLILIFHKPSSPTPEVKLDADKIHEVMMNFVDNAIKYTKKGKVEVSVQANDGHVTYCVKDNGMGISSEVMPVLFQKFSRGKGSFRSHTEGLGLGLYVAKMMIDAHKGKIWAESDGEGKGSRFCFSLPIVK